MVALDTNLLVYAHRADSPFHEASSRLIAKLAEGKDDWAIPWPCLHEFFSIVTHPKIYSVPTPINLAVRQIDLWFESPTLQLLYEVPNHWVVLRELITKGKVRGPLVHDARIAALCLSNGIRELWSADRDFSRFSKLKLRNPLVEL